MRQFLDEKAKDTVKLFVRVPASGTGEISPCDQKKRRGTKNPQITLLSRQADLTYRVPQTAGAGRLAATLGKSNVCYDFAR